jgi:hypothetical protein
MKQLKERQLLKKDAVVNEIERYRWIESEKKGYDIGFQEAADSWIVFYALAWLKYHTPSTRMFRLKPFFRRTLKSKKEKSVSPSFSCR